MSHSADLDRKVLAAVERLGRALRAARQDVATRHEVSLLGLSVIETLADGRPRRVGDLAAELDVSQPTVSDAVTVLDKRGLIRRDRDPADLRSTLVALTDDGDRLAADAAAELAPLLAQAVQEDGFDPTRLVPEDGCPPLFPLWLLKHLPNMVAAHISLAYGCRGPNNTIVTACVAGTQAVGEGFRAVSRGEADIVLAGGADSRIDPLLLLAYTALGTLSRSDRPAAERSRPFDRERDGFVLGEGAAVLVLEEYERAKARGANIYAEVRGFGSSFDAYSVTKPDPTGSGGAKAIRAALKEGAIDPSDIGYINAHGTATKLNDAMETAAVKSALGPAAETVHLSSIKSMIGHAIGAAGAIEAAALALTLKTGVVPPTINLTHPDPACDLDYTPGSAREGRVRYGLSTSFGFGGQNGAVVMAAA
jgi:3-oxoacyl-[acyl-carrier-protein] synthase II